MAKLKKTAKTSARKSSTARKAQPERISKSITESAQQIWLAGMGAFNRAQAEGSKLFETLVRDVVEGRVGQARERAVDTWDKLEKVFEDRVQRALVKLGVPGRDDLNALTQRVERLTEELRKANGGSAPKAARAPRKAAAPKPAKAPRQAKAPKATKAAKAPARKAAKAAAEAPAS